MHEFPANSARVKRGEGPPQQDEPIERVTSGEAVQRKRGLGRQFKRTFINGTARGAAEYVVADVVVPTVRDLIFEAFQSGLERLVYGESRIRRSGGSSYPSVGHVNYQGISSNKPPASRVLSQRSRARHDFGEIRIQSRQEAEEVIERMFDILSRYGQVTVADLYALTGIQSSHTDVKWGWSALRGAKVASLRGGGYLLDLPTPESLER